MGRFAQPPRLFYGGPADIHPDTFTTMQQRDKSRCAAVPLKRTSCAHCPADQLYIRLKMFFGVSNRALMFLEPCWSNQEGSSSIRYESRPRGPFETGLNGDKTCVGQFKGRVHNLLSKRPTSHLALMFPFSHATYATRPHVTTVQQTSCTAH